MRHAHMHHRCGRGARPVPWALAMSGGPGGPMWGWGGGFGHGRGGDPFRMGPPRRGRRARGEIRAAILLLLAEEPRNGYGLMQEVEVRSGGAWRPSPGSVYPALAQLEDEGLIEPAGAEQGKAFALTEAGRAYVEEHRDHLGAPWEAAGAAMPEGLADLRKAAGQLAMASMQVAQTGDAALIAAAREVLDNARKALYRLLAGDEDEER